ncbi:ABC transporter permease [Streptomyces sp. MBT98]|uniref:ABC transporter permease n=1 Tax=Streptomyces sp. MBT98 TaxID=2800412 RepID=UPI00190D9FCB|nr:ABC transporter permease [Streptomyces sp. MBT98]MBK3618724.1 ABC transporter permease [Streptomyces sp. MBT98]
MPEVLRNQLSAELLKLRTGLALPALLLVALAFCALGQLGLVYAESDPASAGAELTANIVGLGASAALFATLLGALHVTGEFSSGSIGRTVLYAPGRSAVVGAKLLATTVSGLVFGVAAVVFDGSTWTTAAAVLTICTLAGPWGAAIGFVVRNRLAAVLGLVVWGTLGQVLVLGQLPELGRFLPEGAQFALLGDASGFPDALAAPYGLLLLVGWTAAMSLAGTRLFTHRDV